MTPSTRHRDSGYSLVEMMIVAGLLFLVLGSALASWVSTRRHASALQDRVEGLEEVHRSLRRLIRELRGARRFIAPLPGAEADGRLIFVDGSGQVVRYRWVPREGAGVNAWTREIWNHPVEIAHPALSEFRCRIAAVPPGRDPGLVHLSIAFPGPDDRPVHLFTSVRSRALEVRCPLDR